jgi:hypothetical protein
MIFILPTIKTMSTQLQELYDGVAWVRSHLSHYLESGQVQRDHPPMKPYRQVLDTSASAMSATSAG